MSDGTSESTTTRRFAGQVALVTGAARGQGRSHALALAREGASVVLVDICADLPTAAMHQAGEANLNETVARIEAFGAEAVGVRADVRDLDQMRAAVAVAIGTYGRLDVVSANAGIVSFGKSWELSAEASAELIAVNLTGAWATCAAASSAMIELGNGGTIVLTGSVGSAKAGANVAHYVASKHGIVGLMKTLAIELAPYRIRVNTVCPTNVDTDMIMNRQTMSFFVPDEPNPTREQFAAAARTMHLLDVPWIEPQDVSDAVLFLASRQARYITGAVLPIDAGAWTI
jgi:SDR family mycofactocin-dependent oxidoreductase